MFTAETIDGHIGHGNHQNVGEIHKVRYEPVRVVEGLVDVPPVAPEGDSVLEKIVEVRDERFLSSETVGVGVDLVRINHTEGYDDAGDEVGHNIEKDGQLGLAESVSCVA